MSVVGRVHGGYVHSRRVQVLAAHLSAVVPRDARLLDVGCGDGLLSSLLAVVRPDLEVTGIDVRARPDAHIPVSLFDGARIPLEIRTPAESLRQGGRESSDRWNSYHSGEGAWERQRVATPWRGAEFASRETLRCATDQPQ